MVVISIFVMSFINHSINHNIPSYMKNIRNSQQLIKSGPGIKPRGKEIIQKIGNKNFFFINVIMQFKKKSKYLNSWHPYHELLHLSVFRKLCDILRNCNVALFRKTISYIIQSFCISATTYFYNLKIISVVQRNPINIYTVLMINWRDNIEWRVFFLVRDYINADKHSICIYKQCGYNNVSCNLFSPKGMGMQWINY